MQLSVFSSSTSAVKKLLTSIEVALIPTERVMEQVQRKASSLLRKDKMMVSLPLIGSCTKSGMAGSENGEEAGGSNRRWVVQ